MCCLPLCTAIVSPTNSGVIVERRDHVLIGRLSLVARAASTFFDRWSSTNGPFLIERAIFYPRLAFGRMPAAHDHGVGALVPARLVALGRRAPGRDRVAAAVGPAAVGVIHGIHADAPDRGTDAAPAIGTGLADGTQVVLLVAHFADHGAAIDV